jgi:acylglycerol lipase
MARAWLSLLGCCLLAGLSACGGPPTYPAKPATTTTASAATAATAGIPTVDHGTGIFRGAGERELFEQWWRPISASGSSSTSNVKSVLVIVHGLKDHSSRYAAFADRLAQKGVAVYAFDLRGHAHSAGQRVGIESFDEYIEDLNIFMLRVKAREGEGAPPGKKMFLFGHSMGGAIATLYSMKKQPYLNGLILSGAALRVNVCPLKVGGTKLTASVAPNAGVFNLDLDKFSRDPNVVKEGKADPLVYQDGAPAKTARELLAAIRVIENNAGAINVPLLALHGAADDVTDPQGSKTLVANAASTDKTLKIYPTLVHDLLHEPEKEMVMTDIEKWMADRSP